VKAASALLIAAVLGWACLRLRDSAQLIGFFALALLAVLLTNTVAWTYQYLLVGALLWMGLMLRAEADADVSTEAQRGQ
jgi:Na+/H+ antiporter NhaA